MVPFQNCVQPFWPPSKMDRAAKLGLTLDTMGNTYTDLLVWNHLLNWNETWMDWSLGSVISKLYLMVPTSDKDDCHTQLCFTLDPIGKYCKNCYKWAIAGSRKSLVGSNIIRKPDACLIFIKLIIYEYKCNLLVPYMS